MDLTGTPHLINECKDALASNNLQYAHACAMQIIHNAPSQPEGYYYVAQIPMAASQYAKAVPILQKSLQLSTTSQLIQPSEIIAALMQCYGQTHNAKATAELLDYTLTQVGIDAITRPQDLDTIGVTLSRFEWQIQALPFYKKAIESEHFNDLSAIKQAAMLSNTAACCNYIGQLDDAITYYQQAITIDSHDAKSQWALTRLQPAGPHSDPMARIDELQAALAQSERIHQTLYLSNALFLAYDHLEQYQDAANALQSAYDVYCQELVNHGMGYDANKHQQWVKQLRELALRHSVQSSPGNSTNEQPQTPFTFVVGLPRSGTSLYDASINILNQSTNPQYDGSHPSIVSLGERDDIELLTARMFPDLGNVSDEDCIQGLNTIRQVYQQQTHARLATIAKQGSIDVTDIANTPVSDKMHLNLWYAPIILASMPNANIVCIKKQKRDAMWSNYKQLFNIEDARFNYAYDLNHLDQYYDFHLQQVQWLQAHYPDRVTVIDYENLVPQLEQLQLTNNESASSVLQHDESQRVISTASSHQLRNGVTNKYIGQWKHYQFLFDHR